MYNETSHHLNSVTNTAAIWLKGKAVKHKKHIVTYDECKIQSRVLKLQHVLFMLSNCPVKSQFCTEKISRTLWLPRRFFFGRSSLKTCGVFLCINKSLIWIPYPRKVDINITCRLSSQLPVLQELKSQCEWFHTVCEDKYGVLSGSRFFKMAVWESRLGLKVKVKLWVD